MIKGNLDSDFNLFREFKKQRNYLIDVPQFKEIYALSYIIYNLTPTIEFDTRLAKYSKLMRRDLTSAIDLIDLQHFESVRRDLRSMIETSFRIIGYSVKQFIYHKRIANKIYTPSSQIKNIKQAIDTHKIGKLTNTINDLFKDNIIYSNIDFLLSCYTSYSNVVHTNSLESTFHTDLKSLTNHTNKEYETFLNEILLLLSHTIIVIYSSLLALDIQNQISQQDFYYISSKLNKHIEKDHLIQTQDNFIKDIVVE